MYRSNLSDVPRLIESKFSDTILENALDAHEGEETTMSMLMDAVLEPIAGERHAKAGAGDTNLRGLYSPSNAENGERNGRWIGLELDASKKRGYVISMFFNAIAERVRNKCNIAKKCMRVFSNKRANKPHGDKNGWCSRKPDVVVLDAGKEEGVDWGDIRGCFEVKINNNSDSRAEAHRQIRQHVCMIFKNQPGRRFVLSATLLDEQMVFIVHDRVGELASEEFNIHDDPERLVRIVVGFAFCTEKYLGYDPSYYTRDGETFIRLGEQEYQVVRDIHVDSSICGRGTLVRELCPVSDSDAPVVAGHKLVGKKGNYVLKDAWVDRSRKRKEWDLLEDLGKKNFGGIVKMELHAEAKVDGKPDTTGTDRAVFQELVDENYVDELGNKGIRKVERWRTRKEWKHFKNLEEREHHFLLLRTLGKPLESFRSKKELVSAFRDIFKTIEKLEEDGKLHGDLSLNNVVLVDDDDMDGETLANGKLGAPAKNKSGHAHDDESSSSSNGAELSPRLRKGVIIDFDYAVDKKKEAKTTKKGKKGKVYHQSRAYRTGTMPFMAAEVLRQNLPGSKKPLPKDSTGLPIIHDYYHDLESVFYMLCWLCIAQAGPNSKDRLSTERFDYQESAIGQWSAAGQDEPKYLTVAAMKVYMVNTVQAFEEEVLGDFHRYFRKLKEYVMRLREVICPEGSLNEAQRESIALGKSPPWIGKPCKRRPKDEVFQRIDKILEEAIADSDLDKDEDEDKDEDGDGEEDGGEDGDEDEDMNGDEDEDKDEGPPVASSLKPGKSCVVEPSPVQRLSRRRRGETNETFVEGENNEDPVVGPARFTDENTMVDDEAASESKSSDESERAHTPTDDIKSVRIRLVANSAPVYSLSTAGKRSFDDDKDGATSSQSKKKRKF